MASNNDVFERLSSIAKQFDKQYIELGEKLSDSTARQPARTLDRLNKETSSLQVTLETELTRLKRHNTRMEKAIAMMNTLLDQKQRLLTEITDKIDQYTITKQSGLASTVDTPRKKVMPTDETCKEKLVTPLKCIENLANEPLAEGRMKESQTPVTLPRTSKDDGEIRTPRLADYLPLEYMYERLDNDFLITKASKRSSTKKTPSNLPRASATAMRSVKSKKSLLLSTPGGKHDVVNPPTPVAPQLIKVHKPDFKKIPKPDFSGRIAMIDVEEYHSQIDGYIKQIISLELLNKVVHKVDLMFNATPGKPVEKQHLIELISPIASAKAKLCISIMVKLNRLTPGTGGCDSMLAVLGNHD
ncbi:uncharacterized protein [Watersipora subatra]|uniref:uncharacterized protein n=1 Tax=Watersipora subatra TaxID=2589382 RepID=UPI00355B08ED